MECVSKVKITRSIIIMDCDIMITFKYNLGHQFNNLKVKCNLIMLHWFLCQFNLQTTRHSYILKSVNTVVLSECWVSISTCSLTNAKFGAKLVICNCTIPCDVQRNLPIKLIQPFKLYIYMIMLISESFSPKKSHLRFAIKNQKSLNQISLVCQNQPPSMKSKLR